MPPNLLSRPHIASSQNAWRSCKHSAASVGPRKEVGRHTTGTLGPRGRLSHLLGSGSQPVRPVPWRKGPSTVGPRVRARAMEARARARETEARAREAARVDTASEGRAGYIWHLA